jgi:hypothetical protein
MKQVTKHPRTRSKKSTSAKSSSPKNSQGNSSQGKPNNTAQNTVERYINLAREALIAGDRVLAEEHYQLAEHYLRLNSEFKENASTPSKKEPAPSLPISDFERLIEQELSAQVGG